VLVLDLLGGGVSLFFSLLGTTLETEDELDSRILGNSVVYQSIVISTADSGMGGQEAGEGYYRLASWSRRVGRPSRAGVGRRQGSLSLRR
jgi:hypothetical protein